MNLREASQYLLLGREQTKDAITKGITFRTKGLVKLKAAPAGHDYDITEEDLEAFIAAYELDDPGRRPPVPVQRALRIEAGFRCALCRQSPVLEYHHMIDWSKVKHHDRANMLAVCPTCHSMCTTGEIPYLDQREVKKMVVEGKSPPPHVSRRQTQVDWDDLKLVITAMGTLVSSSASTDGQRDFTYTDIDHKNALNNLGSEYFALMKDYHEPYFGNIEAFLGSPANEEVAQTYHRIASDIRTRVSQYPTGTAIDAVFLDLIEDANAHGDGYLRAGRNAFQVLMSFMYFSCDVGKKK